MLSTNSGGLTQLSQTIGPTQTHSIRSFVPISDRLVVLNAKPQKMEMQQEPSPLLPGAWQRTLQLG